MPSTPSYSSRLLSSHFSSTEPPASSSFFLMASASAFGTPSLTGLGTPSTRSFASLRPSPVSSRTTLMTWIFLSPAPARTTVKSSFSGTAAAAPPAAAGPPAATATGAAADTPSSDSSSFTSVAASIRLMFFKKSFTCSRVTSIDLPFPPAGAVLRAALRGRACVGHARLGALAYPIHEPRQASRGLVQGAQELDRRHLQEAQELRQHHLARGQRRERLHLGRRQHQTVEHRAFDRELGSLLREPDRQLGDHDRVLEAEDQRQRALQHGPELLVARRLDRPPGERVLRHPTAALRRPHRAPEAVELPRRQPAVLGQHGHGRTPEVVLQLVHPVDLLCPLHAPSSRRGAHGRGIDADARPHGGGDRDG